MARTELASLPSASYYFIPFFGMLREEMLST